MELIVVCLIIMISILLFYIVLLHEELKNTSKEIEVIKNAKSNSLIHTKYNLKSTNQIINQINNFIKQTKELEHSYDKKDKELKKMMINISHDLRTPLTSALGYIDMILKSNLSEEEKQKELKVIEERLKKLEELIHSFFEFSQVVSGSQIPEMESINLNLVLEEAIVNFYEDFEKQNRKIILNCDEKKLIITANKLLLMRIFDNLIGNSYKHSTSNLEINVKVEDKIKISFENTLEQKVDISRIFDEFYTVDISRTKGRYRFRVSNCKRVYRAIRWQNLC